MSYVVVNVLTVPEGNGATLEQRFAGRAGMVEQAPGFERFELLRPAEGTDTYLVYTRWRSKEDFENWQASRAFGAGHGRPDGGRQGDQGDQQPSPAEQQAAPAPAATGSQIWQFEVVQDAG